MFNMHQMVNECLCFGIINMRNPLMGDSVGVTQGLVMLMCTFVYHASLSLHIISLSLSLCYIRLPEKHLVQLMTRLLIFWDRRSGALVQMKTYCTAIQTEKSPHIFGEEYAEEHYALYLVSFMFVCIIIVIAVANVCGVRFMLILDCLEFILI